MKAAAEDGFSVLLDGTNASDDAGIAGNACHRELSVLSPLRECDLTKAEIRMLSRKQDCSWDKPAYACLQPEFLQEKRLRKRLRATEAAEDFLFLSG